MKADEPVALTRSPLNCEATIRGLSPAITKNGSFFVRTHFTIPEVDRRGWRLTVDGGAGRARQFTYGDLRRMPRVTVASTMECAGNGRTGFREPAKGEVRWGVGAIGTARWSGVSVAALLRKVGVGSGATEVVAEGMDVGKPGDLPEPIPFSRSLPLEKAEAPETIVALEMNGRPIPPEHGHPARLIVPGWYGMASVKWLKSIRVISGAPYIAFFNGVKYVYYHDKGGAAVREPVGEMRVKSLITSPLEGDSLPHGVESTISGKAWSGAGRISMVEVDHGSGWQEAELSSPRLGRFAWVPWRLRWVPQASGKLVIATRATDERGNVQPSEPFDNRYQYGYNAVSRIVVDVR